MITCKMCGRCCHFLDDDNKLKACKYLIKLPNGKTLCRIYKKRLGTIIYKKTNGDIVVCKKRTDTKTKYEACPYNV